MSGRLFENRRDDYDFAKIPLRFDNRFLRSSRHVILCFLTAAADLDSSLIVDNKIRAASENFLGSCLVFSSFIWLISGIYIPLNIYYVNTIAAGFVDVADCICSRILSWLKSGAVSIY